MHYLKQRFMQCSMRISHPGDLGRAALSMIKRKERHGCRVPRLTQWGWETSHAAHTQLNSTEVA
jgi:hypothetical protein